MQFDWEEIARQNLQLYAETDAPLHTTFLSVLARLRDGEVVGVLVQREQGAGYVIIVRVSGRDAEYLLVWTENGPGRRLLAYCGPRFAGA